MDRRVTTFKGATTPKDLTILRYLIKCTGKTRTCRVFFLVCDVESKPTKETTTVPRLQTISFCWYDVTLPNQHGNIKHMWGVPRSPAKSPTFSRLSGNYHENIRNRMGGNHQDSPSGHGKYRAPWTASQKKEKGSNPLGNWQ